MRKRIETTTRKLKLLYKDREIGGNLVLWSFIKFLTGPDKVKQAAAALTYHTLFALVPVMAMMIAVANFMGYGEAFKEKVEVLFVGQENIANELLKFVDMYLGNTDWNCSAPHGAGRLMSRSEAKQSFTVSEFKRQMEGIYTTSVSQSTLDECPMAYKSMEDIVSNIGPTAEIAAVIKPIYNFKASGD